MEGFNWSEARRAMRLFCLFLSCMTCLLLSWRGVLFDFPWAVGGWVVCALNWILGESSEEPGNFPDVSRPIEEEDAENGAFVSHR